MGPSKNCWAWRACSFQEKALASNVRSPSRLAEIWHYVIRARLSTPEYFAWQVPTTPTIASIIGAIQAQEALKLIHDMPVEEGKVVISMD